MASTNQKVLDLMCQINYRVAAQGLKIKEMKSSLQKTKDEIDLAEVENSETHAVLQNLIKFWSAMQTDDDTSDSTGFPNKSLPSSYEDANIIGIPSFSRPIVIPPPMGSFKGFSVVGCQDEDPEGDANAEESQSPTTNDEIIPNLDMARCPENGHGLSEKRALSDGKMEYICYCKASYESYGKLKRHYIKKTKEQMHKCPEINCKKEFAESSKLLEHSRKKHSYLVYACNVCYRQFSSKEEKDEHIDIDAACSEKN